MKKIIDLIAGPGTHKDEKLLDYIRKNFLIKNQVTNLCFVCGLEEDKYHTQLSAAELKKLIFEINDKSTIYFFKSFFFDFDRENYLQIMEKACELDIQIFKTDQKEVHVTDDKEWTNKYCEFITMGDIEE